MTAGTPKSGRTPKRYGYARVSTTSQHLDIQLKALKDARCDRVFTDHGVSGAQRVRPGLVKMLAVLEPGDVVVVTKLDRLGRSVQNLADLLVRFRDMRVEFRSLSEAMDTTSSTGKLLYHLFCAFAEWQRDMIVEGTHQGLEAARARGQQLGRRPKLERGQVEDAYIAFHRDRTPIEALAERLEVSASTLRRSFDTLELKCAAEMVGL